MGYKLGAGGPCPYMCSVLQTQCVASLLGGGVFIVSDIFDNRRGAMC